MYKCISCTLISEVVTKTKTIWTWVSKSIWVCPSMECKVQFIECNNLIVVIRGLKEWNCYIHFKNRSVLRKPLSYKQIFRSLWFRWNLDAICYHSLSCYHWNFYHEYYELHENYIGRGCVPMRGNEEHVLLFQSQNFLEQQCNTGRNGPLKMLGISHEQLKCGF